ncbi:LrgB family protein [Metabacillus bambusae]|uniref:LrgB family protein n=1 Tax=Metabacillus bambusae TaxID=2795218 RepID=A0ABS3N562_9BACI|nr:LrgB family protein [Metabacillus bambusae]MBO1513189.1 LrgB family protein [Metabacillus bambusae]
MSLFFSTLFIGITIVIYLLMAQFYNRFTHPLLVPIFTSSLLVVGLLLVTNTSYITYMSGAKWIDELLGPAVVALAIPLYDHRDIVKRNAPTIFFSVIVGAIVGMVSGIILGMMSQINKELIFSIAPKSVTTPIAMEISEIVGGAPALAAVYVMVAGISGAMFGPYLMRVCNIKHSISRGIGFGTASHGIGTARALEIGDVEGALSSISMTLSAVFTSFLCPIILSIFL